MTDLHNLSIIVGRISVTNNKAVTTNQSYALLHTSFNMHPPQTTHKIKATTLFRDNGFLVLDDVY